MTNREKLRLEIGDNNKVIVDDKFGGGDAYTKYFRLSMFPIRSTTEKITLDNVAQVRDTNYTIDNSTGLITMTTAPGNGAVLIAQTYLFNAFSDTELDDILSQYGSDLNMAAAHCCRALATSAAKFFVYTSGDERVDRTKESENFRKMAEAYEAKATKEQSSGIDVGIISSEIYSSDPEESILN